MFSILRNRASDFGFKTNYNFVILKYFFVIFYIKIAYITLLKIRERLCLIDEIERPCVAGKQVRVCNDYPCDLEVCEARVQELDH